MQRISYSCSFIPCKNQRELLTPRVVFAPNSYRCFMENKIFIRTFRGFKSFKNKKKTNKKKNIESPQNFTGCYIKYVDSGLTRRYIEYQKVKKVNNLWQRLSEQHN